MENETVNIPRKKKQGKSNLHLWVTIPIVLGSIALGVYAVQWKSQLIVERFIVDGARHLQAREIVTMSEIKPQSHIDEIDWNDVEAKLLEHPLIKWAEVESQLPDAMRITIIEREPFAVVSGKSLLYIDSEAVLLPRLPAMQFDLPLISGIEGIDKISLGKQAPIPDIFLAIEVLKEAKTVGWYHSISEVKIGAGGEIMLFAMDSGVPIFIGRDDIAAKLARLQTFWKNYVKDGTASQLKYLDLRFDGQVVVKWDRLNNQTTRIPL
ncbi:MAG: FtsQ-type POTRA domain-containing protein [Bacteroidetes bacterium]|nr:MAG: FtsQ-type POTRA domain-containing protein [Bacteroidota bacterium]